VSFPTRVFVVTDLGSVPEAALEARLRAVPVGSGWRVVVQLRDRGLPSAERAALAGRLRGVTRELGNLLLVNADVDLAIAVGADGVHLPGSMGSDVEAARVAFAGRGLPAYVSVACHTVDEVMIACASGADAALLSPIFASPGKGTPLGPGALRVVRARLRSAYRPPGAHELALVALGGVDASNAGACMEAGADGVAAIRAEPAALLAAIGGPSRTGTNR
jgi:thiamine-phosphate pyrophosphorylase